jgi:hypothetical protein
VVWNGDWYRAESLREHVDQGDVLPQDLTQRVLRAGTSLVLCAHRGSFGSVPGRP